MCLTCGCSDNAKPTLTNLETGEMMAITPENSKDYHSHTHTLPDGTVITHSHDRDSHSTHNGEPSQIHAKIHSTTITLEQNILAKNKYLLFIEYTIIKMMFNDYYIIYLI